MKFTTLIDLLGSRERVINTIMSVYDSGDRNKMLNLASEIVDIEAKNGYRCGEIAGKWERRCIVLTALFGTYLCINEARKFKEKKAKDDKTE